MTKPSNQDTEQPEKFAGLSGLDYLSKLPTGRQALVKAVGEGRTKMSGLTSYRGTQRMDLAKDVMRAYPTYDQRWIDASFSMAKDATSGNIAKNARSLNTAIGHLQQFDEAAQKLKNVNITGYNTLQNWMRQHTGDPRMIAVETAAKALRAELASATKGGASGAAGTEQEIADWGNTFATNLSQAQFDQAVHSTIKILGSRISALNQQYKQAPYHPEGFNVISPPAREILDSYGFDFSKYEGNKNAGNAPSGEDSAAIEWAKQNRNDPRAKEILQANGVQ